MPAQTYCIRHVQLNTIYAWLPLIILEGNKKSAAPIHLQITLSMYVVPFSILFLLIS